MTDHPCKDMTQAQREAFFATKAAECLQLAKSLGWKPESIDKSMSDG